MVLGFLRFHFECLNSNYFLDAIFIMAITFVNYLYGLAKLGGFK